MGSEKSLDAVRASALWTQKLPSWKPMFTPQYFIAVLVVVGAAFVAVGVGVAGASAGVAEQTLRYDDKPECVQALAASPCGGGNDPLCWRALSEAAQGAIANDCALTWTVASDMKAPVYFYYELGQFYQNQRVYVKSQAPKQLRGDDDWPSLAAYAEYLSKQCVESEYDQCTTGATQVPGSSPARFYCNPCGLVARSFFTDTFELSDSSGAAISWSADEVAWPRDQAEKFKSTPATSNTMNVRTPDEDALVTDPDFIVWMRTAALPDFRKLHRIVSTRSLVKGEVLTLKVRNNYDVSSFGGSKQVVLSTMSWIGGKNHFLGAVYIGVGALCLFLAVLFVAIECMHRRRKKSA